MFEVVGLFDVTVVVEGGFVVGVLSVGGADVTGSGLVPGPFVAVAPGVVTVGGVVVVGGPDGNGSTFGCLSNSNRGSVEWILVDGRCSSCAKG